MLFDVAWDRILERFKLENLKYLLKKALAQGSWQMVSMFLKFNQIVSETLQ